MYLSNHLYLTLGASWKELRKTQARIQGVQRFCKESLPECQEDGSEEVNNRQVQNKDTVRFLQKGFSSTKQDINYQGISQRGQGDDKGE